MLQKRYPEGLLTAKITSAEPPPREGPFLAIDHDTRSVMKTKSCLGSPVTHDVAILLG